MKIQSIALAMTLTTFFDSPGMALPFTGNVTDSVHVLNAIPIISERISNFSASNKIQTIDSISIQNYQWNNLGELLNDQSQVVVKTYGPGLTATTSFRGSDAEQTAVLWNGFNINSPMLAQLDFGLIPVDFLQEVKVQYGGASALFGSGAVGGIIHLDNTAQYSQGLMLSANTSYGSFNANQNGLSASLSTNNYIFSVKAFDRTATNNFPFLDIAKVGTPIEYQTNSQLRQWGLLQENYFKLNPYQEITVRLWYQNSDRHIPPSMTTQDTTASEKDNFLRITSEFKRSTKNQTLSVRAAFFDEQLNYFDPAVNLSSYSSAKTLIAEIEDKIILNNNHIINLGVNNTFTQAISNGYPNSPTQNRSAFFCSYKYSPSNKRWYVILNAREEAVQNQIVPLTPSVGIQRQLIKQLSLKVNASRNYRIPSFNDLYWIPGGNPNLKPENGWSADAGLYYQLKVRKFITDISAVVFNSQTNSQITWLPPNPGEGENYWYPVNLTSVWSRGFEATVSTIYCMNKITTRFAMHYNYVHATMNGDQLPYIPEQSIGGTMGITYKTFSLDYNQTYTGKRYILSDDSELLLPFQVSNLVIAKQLNVSKAQLKLFLRMNNVFNESYSSIVWYPMPLRNYQVGLSITFHSPTAHQSILN